MGVKKQGLRRARALGMIVRSGTAVSAPRKERATRSLLAGFPQRSGVYCAEDRKFFGEDVQYGSQSG